MKLWETEFYALSILNGELESFRGVFIEAKTFQDALKAIRKRGMDYLQLTGEWFTDMQAILDNDEFYEKLTAPQNIVKGMTYDEFNDWLDLAITKDDLFAALERFKSEKGMEDYVKVIEVYIENYDEKNNDKEGGEEASDEEVG